MTVTASASLVSAWHRRRGNGLREDCFDELAHRLITLGCDHFELPTQFGRDIDGQSDTMIFGNDSHGETCYPILRTPSGVSFQ
jgi:hypothetical protein